jgi:hypothetical protein
LDKDSNIQFVPGFLTLLFGIGCWHNWQKCSKYPMIPTCKNWEFVEQVKALILIFFLELSRFGEFKDNKETV